MKKRTSHNRRKITIPELNEELAEDLGHHIGDGCMTKESYKGRIKYRFYYVGDAVLDLDYFKTVLIPRKRKLYGLDKSNLRFQKGTVCFQFNSVELFEFYKQLGVKHGKKDYIEIPEFIMNGTNVIKAAFLRGLFDSDGSLVFNRKYKKVKYYPRVSFAMKAQTLFEDTKRLLDSLGVTYTTYRRDSSDPRFKNPTRVYEIHINGKKKVFDWMRRVGTNNKRHSAKYEFWLANKYYDKKEMNGPEGI